MSTPSELKKNPSPAKFVSPRTVALYGVLTALTAAITYASYTPFSPTRGYFNLGEIMVFFSALTFGWRAGMVCGGIGSAAADVLLGAGIYAPGTLVAKGAEGLVSGLLARRKLDKPLIVAVAIGVGGACMIATYFFYELIALDVGLGKAIAEVPINVLQVVIGGTIGALLSFYVRKSYPSISEA